MWGEEGSLSPLFGFMSVLLVGVEGFLAGFESSKELDSTQFESHIGCSVAVCMHADCMHACALQSNRSGDLETTMT